ncbi:thymidylate synthase [Klosneuvirus KNV1]|uniref:thymidylate synthase n=1 Tax=Klosneuvirus KNV1 TaxID=1977640 RepID=A0A1V0SJ94_9VIRU|nr:thymidylate synthase [Klosneuvirus KNV1]
MNSRINLIVAYDTKKGISKDGKIPWDIKEDSNFFQDVTSREYLLGKKNVLIMGKLTWKALPANYRALKNRITIIVSKTMTLEELKQDNTTGEEVYLSKTFLDAVHLYNDHYIFICGGSQIYREAIEHIDMDYYYLTEIDDDYGCDNFFPYDDLLPNLTDQEIDGSKVQMAELMDQKTFFVKDYVLNKKVNITVKKYRNLARCLNSVPENVMMVNPEENQYLNLLNEILQKGHFRSTRNSNTWSLFGRNLEFDLNKFPLLSTKKVFLRGIFEELLFFLKGDTNANHLSEKNVKIWELNTSRDFLDKNNLKHYETGSLGPLYGYNFLHFGYPYETMNTDYTNKGFNQIDYCLNLLKNEQTSRRILLTSFNPSIASQGVLYPCHGLFIQFYVEENNKLSCMMTQRSGDAFLGIKY